MNEIERSIYVLVSRIVNALQYCKIKRKREMVVRISHHSSVKTGPN